MLSRSQVESDMAAEMRHHLEEQTRRNVAGGMPPEEARLAAHREFGNVARVQEVARDQRGIAWLEHGLQDLRYAGRTLAKSGGYTALAVATLALGIAATTAIFSVVYGVLLKPYPYARSHEIWAPVVMDPKVNRPVGLRLVDYLELQKLPAVASAMATSYGQVTLTGGINPEVITAPLVTGTAFPFLEVPPLLGRGLTPADFTAVGEAEPVVVLSFKLWQRLFNGDPNVLGRTIELDRRPHTIVGVMPPRFGWYTNDGLWRPLPTVDGRRGAALIMRLKPGVTREVAAQQLDALVRTQAEREPGRFPKDGFTTGLRNYLDVTVASGQMRTSLHVLFGAVGFLLLIACTNVANLQLARGAGRSRELAVRLALGASRGRIVRQLLTESVLLSVAGGLLGIGLAAVLVDTIVKLMPENFVPNEARVTMNGWVLGFSTAVAVLSGIASGLVPAWQCSRPDVSDALKDGTLAAGSHRGNRTRAALVVVQVALSVVLVVGASLTAVSFVRLQTFDRGLNTDNMLLLRVPLDAARYPTFEQRHGFIREFLGRLRALPGVTHVTVGLAPGVDTRSGVDVVGHPKPADGISLNYIDAEYLATYGMRVKEGRFFTEHDVARGERVALVNETAAKLWANGESPIGRVIAVDALAGGGQGNLPAPGAKKEVTVIGILPDAPHAGPLQPVSPVVFVPYTLRAPTGRAFVVRSATAPAGLLGAVRAELRALDPEQPMLNPLTFDELIERQDKPPRFNMALFSSLAGVALLLAAAGIYSVLSYAVAQRSREIGIRMALGASHGDVQRMFLGAGAVLVGLGLLIGTVASAGLGWLLRSVISSQVWVHPVAFVAALVLLAGAATLACLLPSRRATRVNPMIALRAE